MIPLRAAAKQGGSWVIWYVLTIHVVWAFLLLHSPTPGFSTPVHGLEVILPRYWLAAALLLISASAWWGSRQPTGLRGWVALIPQQAATVATAASAIHAAAIAQYSDGVPRAWPFILADQLPAIMLLALHTAAVIEHSLPPGRLAGVRPWQRYPTSLLLTLLGSLLLLGLLATR